MSCIHVVTSPSCAVACECRFLAYCDFHCSQISDRRSLSGAVSSESAEI